MPSSNSSHMKAWNARLETIGKARKERGMSIGSARITLALGSLSPHPVIASAVALPATTRRARMYGVSIVTSSWL